MSPKGSTSSYKNFQDDDWSRTKEARPRSPVPKVNTSVIRSRGGSVDTNAVTKSGRGVVSPRPDPKRTRERVSFSSNTTKTRERTGSF